MYSVYTCTSTYVQYMDIHLCIFVSCCLATKISKAPYLEAEVVEEVMGWLTNLLQDPNWDAFARAAHVSQLESRNIHNYT